VGQGGQHLLVLGDLELLEAVRGVPERHGGQVPGQLHAGGHVGVAVAAPVERDVGHRLGGDLHDLADLARGQLGVGLEEQGGVAGGLR
jgi:hypothetical protein